MAYADLYNPKEAPNRRVKRIIEVENKKERQRERVGFNDEVRKLVEHIKDKDYRYQKFVLKVEAEKAAKRQKIDDEKEAVRQVHAERMRIHKQEIADQLAKQEAYDLEHGNIEEVVVEVFECNMCKKSFKSQAKMDEHLKSKMHKK